MPVLKYSIPELLTIKEAFRTWEREKVIRGENEVRNEEEEGKEYVTKTK